MPSMVRGMGRFVRFGALLAGLLVAVVAQGGTGLPGESFVKWVANADGGFFFVDSNGNLLWDGQPTDAKFRIEGGTLLGKLAAGDLGGNGQTQIVVVTETKVFADDGDFSWTPASNPNDRSFFFAPNVGLEQAMVSADFNADNADDVLKVGTGQFIFVDANGNQQWDGAPLDAKFRIEGGTTAGQLFTIDLGSGPQVGLFTSTKVFLDDGDFSWTPASNPNDTSFFFAPNQGNIDAVLVGDWNNDGTDNIGKVSGGFIFLDLNGNLAWDGQPADGKFRFEGGNLTGPFVAGRFAGAAVGDLVAQFSETKIFIDLNGDAAWTPAVANTDAANFFAPNVGSIQGTGSGNFQAP